VVSNNVTAHLTPLFVALWLHLSVYYVWTAMIADWTVRMGLLLWRYRSERWKAIQVIR
jgi:Na+-driven multidrug efflux pump